MGSGVRLPARYRYTTRRYTYTRVESGAAECTKRQGKTRL